MTEREDRHSLTSEFVFLNAVYLLVLLVVSFLADYCRLVFFAGLLGLVKLMSLSCCLTFKVASFSFS